MVFPSFLFINGMSVCLAVKPEMASDKNAWFKILKRVFLLFLIGFLLNLQVLLLRKLFLGKKLRHLHSQNNGRTSKNFNLLLSYRINQAVGSKAFTSTHDYVLFPSTLYKLDVRY